MLHEFITMTEAEMTRLTRDIYAESCRENAQERYPDESLTEAIRKEEQGYINFFKTFFAQERNRYYILEGEGVWVCALRLTKLEDGYYLEALETPEAYRRKGLAVRLIQEVIALLRERGAVCIRSCVAKTNTASLATHKKCGFIIAQENGVDYLDHSTSPYTYGMLYTE